MIKIYSKFTSIIQSAALKQHKSVQPPYLFLLQSILCII